MKTSDYVKECLEIVGPLTDIKKESGKQPLTTLTKFLDGPLDRLHDCLLTIQADLETKNDHGCNHDL
ncbi:hypothetical protein ACPV3A_16615 [Paenibacillus sp. Dod16]|uniref:hypothetical protein n=1 Tax=Paenibacillus sp. Dod16 TaxID=3416392 RepID=UPI003CECFAB0